MSESPDPMSPQPDIAALHQRIAQLTEELTETNMGVVALYAELEDKADQLREASELKSRFLSYMSHEFRTPLGAIRSISRILLDQLDGPINDEQTKQLMFIDSSARELSEMVNDLLDLARVEAGRITISPDWFDMVDLFSALRGMFKPLINSDAVTLAFDEPESGLKLYHDDKKLSLILRNFVSNALKFTPRGRVTVGAKRLGDEWIEFSVTDTGVGIAAEHQENLFQDFVQVDSPLQRRLLGSGLGLAVSRRYAELLGGRVGVHSEVGKGSTFYAVVPQRYAAEEAATHA